MTGFRIGERGRIDRSKRLSFRWEGRKLLGHPGDTLASALLASGERIFGRSFKHHRPRGVTSAGVEEAGALVTLHHRARWEANARATTVELVEGLEARGQNAWPSIRRDIAEINDLAGGLIGAGFYYKTFMGPRIGPLRGARVWMGFEALIRRAAGMGRAARLPDPDHYETVHDHCDLLVAGAGPAGIAAALEAAEAGLDVILAERDFEAGGDLLAADPWEEIGGAPAEVWRAGRLAALAATGRVRLLTRTTVFGLFDGLVAGALEGCADHIGGPSPQLPRERLRIIRPAQIILATGALERGLAFGGNDRPGVMGAGAMRTYLNRFGVCVGRRLVIAGAHDGAHRAAISLARAGAATTLLEARAEIAPEARRALTRAGVDYRLGRVPVEAIGRKGLRQLRVGRWTGDGAPCVAEDLIPCDALGVSAGLAPVIHLASHRGPRPVWRDDLQCFLAGQTDEPVTCIGAAAGFIETEDAIASGRAAGHAAARALGRRTRRKGPRAPWAATPEHGPAPVFEIRAKGLRVKSFVDLQHDVTTADIRQSHEEGLRSVEHLKRYTTLGMATDQGKTSNVIGLALAAELAGAPMGTAGTTTFRPPYTPVSIGAIAGAERGRDWRPIRRTPMDEAHEAAGALWIETGLWRRAWAYPRPGEGAAEAGAREAACVRAALGVVDVSTLGKIAVSGPDAAEFLDRVCVNRISTLAPGRVRYAAMLREDGIVLDDGAVWRLEERSWLLTTTTAEAAPVLAHLDRLAQTRWPDLRLRIDDVADQWAAIALAGPRARKAMEALAPGLDLSGEGFAYMSVKEVSLALGDGAPKPGFAARVSFSGELGWEVYAPASHGLALWRVAMAAVAALGGCAYGLEALDILRIEKGFPTANEIDGRATLADLGLAGMAARDKSHIGARLAERPALASADRPALVGLRTLHPGAVFSAGAILMEPGATAGHGIGWISCAADSPALGERIGLGFAAGGLAAREGATLIAADPIAGRETEVRVVSPRFFDPMGSRARA